MFRDVKNVLFGILIFSFSCIAEHKLNIILLGGTDNDRTALGNIITGQKVFHCPILFSDKQCVEANGVWRGMPLTVVKAPDVYDLPLLSVAQEMIKYKTDHNLQSSVMLLLVNSSDFTEEKRQSLNATLSIFGKDAFKNSMVIITSNEDKNYVSLDKIMKDCNQRQHTINLDKKDLANKKQELMEKIEIMLSDYREQCVTADPMVVVNKCCKACCKGEGKRVVEGKICVLYKETTKTFDEMVEKNVE